MIPTPFQRKPNRPLCMAHRGASALAPENTIASFVKAMELGTDIIEFDVQLTHDQVPVVFHDNGLERTTDNWGDLFTTNLEELKLMDAGKWFSPSFKGEKVPTLEEAFLTMNQKVLIYLEIKRQNQSNEVLVQKVVEMIQQKGLQEQVVVSSFDFQVIDLVKSANNQIYTGVNFKLPNKVEPWVREKPDRVDLLCPRISILNEEFFQFAQEVQKPVYAWFSDKPDLLKKWGDHPQVHALATNNPEFFFSAFPK